MMKRSRGYFFTFEGGDGAGKTTLIANLAGKLRERGVEVVTTLEPGGTTLGLAIRGLVLQTREDGSELDPRAELALFLAARAQHVQELILPALERGACVLCDRFSHSSIAYQGLGRGLGMEKVKELSNWFSDNCQPDYTFYLDLDPRTGLERKRGVHHQKDRIEEASLEFHSEVRKAFLKMAQEDPAKWRVIDASKSAEEVLGEAENLVRDYV
ncbi:MAG: dTMP kinase [Chlamydiia bacterium]|nr:dTMP kinase [Chlamydiia bacterium]